jgi:hypothetical protein
MLAVCLFAEKNRSVRALTTSAKRTVCGQSLVSALAKRAYIVLQSCPLCIAWLNILAAANQDSKNKLIRIKDVLQSFYEIYGRSFFSRYDYKNVPSESANALVAHLDVCLNTNSLEGMTHRPPSGGPAFTIARVYSFGYKDPIDGSISKNWGQVIEFKDGSRVVFRLSGTGSQGATVRMYVERYAGPDVGKEELAREAKEGLIEVALNVSVRCPSLAYSRYMHAVSHSLAHQASSVTRTKARWQLYAALASSSLPTRSPQPYLATPPTSLCVIQFSSM